MSTARQFLQASTVKKIAKILAETGSDPEALEIETTESIAMTDVNFTVSILHYRKWEFRFLWTILALVILRCGLSKAGR